MDRKARMIYAVGGLLMVLAVMFPPWVGSLSLSRGYHFIAPQLIDAAEPGRVNTTLLFIELLVIGCITWVVAQADRVKS